MVAISLMSAPAAKTFSPPKTTTARMSGRDRISAAEREQLVLHLGVERVHRRAVEADRADAVVHVEGQEVSHLREPSRACGRIRIVPTPGPPDLPPPLGITPRGDGSADVAVYAGHADGVELCLFDTGDRTGRDRTPGAR